MSVKEISGGASLPPADFGEKPMARRTKGTPFTNGGTGFDLTFNYLPPGEDIGNQVTASDVKRIDAVSPSDPITSSRETN